MAPEDVVYYENQSNTLHLFHFVTVNTAQRPRRNVRAVSRPIYVCNNNYKLKGNPFKSKYHKNRIVKSFS